MYPASWQIDPFALKQRDLKILSVVKFPYVHYVTIICVLSLLGCCIKADTAVLVGALLILVNRLKCPPVRAHPMYVHHFHSTAVKVLQLMALGTHQCRCRVA